MSLRPYALPRLRDQTLRHLDDPAMPVRAKTGAGNQAGLDEVAEYLRTAGPDRVVIEAYGQRARPYGTAEDGIKAAANTSAARPLQ